DRQFEVDNIPSQKAILDSCLGVVLIEEQIMTVRFIHYFLEEYFQNRIHFPDGYENVGKPV
ncbi:hypothetical protein EV426DRAFT_535961, partial [Tirmania nivea]